MKPFCCPLAVALAVPLYWLPLCSAWVSQKCLMLDVISKYAPFDVSIKCPRHDLTAVCDQVTDVRQDLLRIPGNVRTLCLWGKEGLVLQPNAFARFQHLRGLYIHGCLSTILPGAFDGQSTLRFLSLVSPKQISVLITSEVFRNLRVLEELTLTNYALAAMATDVFLHLPQLRSLEATSHDEDFSEVMCRLVRVNTTLTNLNMKMENMGLLKSPECLTYLDTFRLLHTVFLTLPNISAIEKDALQCFKRITYISMPLDEPLQAQLLQSGIERIDHLDIRLGDLNVESLCKTVLSFTVTNLTVQCITLQGYHNSAWAKCHSLQYLRLHVQQLSNISLSFIHTLSNVTHLYLYVDHSSAALLSSLCPSQVSSTAIRKFGYLTRDPLVIQAKQLACLSHLESMDLFGSQVEAEDLAFEGLYKLRSLWIDSRNKPRNVTVSFRGLNQVQSIYANRFMPAVIVAKYFVNLTNLVRLTAGTEIHTIEDFAFMPLSKLSYLDLTGNRISKIQANSFSGLCNLETLLLEKNPLKHIEALAFSQFPSLRVFRLGYLRFSPSEHPSSQLLNLSALFGVLPPRLANVSISSVSQDPVTLVIPDNSVPNVNLSVSLLGKRITVLGCDSPFVKSVLNLEVTADSFSCGPDDSSSAFQYFSSVEQLIIGQWSMNTAQDLSGLCRLVHLRQLKLFKVNLAHSAGLDIMLHNLTRLEHLLLDECWLDSLQGSSSVDLQSLKYLRLKIKGETSVTESFFEPLTNLKLVILGQQHIRCDCESSRFEEWARWQTGVEVFLFNHQQGALQCQVGGKVQDLKTFGQKHCSPNLGFVLFVTTATFNLLFMLAVFLQQLAGEYLLALYHIARGWVAEALRKDTRGRYDYDAFVSYSERDERWVVGQLLPALEQRGPPVLRLCLHTRDFQPGKDVVENITDSLYRSRRTLCLVSRHFLRSGWCSLEMCLATQRLQVEQRDVLIMVFLEEVPWRLLSAHHRLARLVKTRTYIHWPQEPAQQEAFWDRLWAKLASQS